eukprot:s114_g29.t1
MGRLHVDDYLGAGEGVNGAGDLEGEYDGSFATFRDRLCGLSRCFRFGSWDFGPVIRFCGADVEQPLANDSLVITMKEYVKKVHPVTLEKTRKAMSNEPCDEKEQRCLRALVGALAWPANQRMPQLSASVNILQASVSKPQIKDVNEGNKVLRFAKNVAQEYKMKMVKHAWRMEDVKFSVYSDAAWAVRSDGTSQGGFMIFASSEEELRSGQPMNLTIIDWHSKKLEIIACSRSAGISSSGGRARVVQDFLEHYDQSNIEKESTLGMSGLSYVLTDAKNLSMLQSQSLLDLISERRTAIEVAIVAERVKAMQAEWKWINSFQQLADGLTKPSAKDKFA